VHVLSSADVARRIMLIGKGANGSLLSKLAARCTEPSVLIGELFKKFCLFLNTRIFRNMRKENGAPSQKVSSRNNSNNGRNVGNGVSPVEGITLKGTMFKML
jgi:hypothetical protein